MIRILFCLLLMSSSASLAQEVAQELVEQLPAELRRIIDSAHEQVGVTLYYDPSYSVISFPGGDVPMVRGVCTDVIIRAYRSVGIDLQLLVNRDMRKAFSAYPRNWGLSRPDPNIDHRRVPNLMVFFARQGQTLPTSTNAGDYHPGDLVTWNLGGGITHIGIVVDQKSPQSGRYLIVHNIGQGPQMEDVLFNWKIIGHYRYLGESSGH